MLGKSKIYKKFENFTHNLIFRSHGTQNRIKTGRVITPDWLMQSPWFFHSVFWSWKYEHCSKIKFIEIFFVELSQFIFWVKFGPECKLVLGHTNKTVHHRNIILVQCTYLMLVSNHSKYELNWSSQNQVMACPNWKMTNLTF